MSVEFHSPSKETGSVSGIREKFIQAFLARRGARCTDRQSTNRRRS